MRRCSIAYPFPNISALVFATLHSRVVLKEGNRSEQVNSTHFGAMCSGWASNELKKELVKQLHERR